MSLASDKLAEYAGKIDAATNAIAARIQALIDKGNSGGATVEEITAALQPEVDRLTEMGKDPNAPPTA